MKELLYPSEKTIKKLTIELNLKDVGKYAQDWEYEVADVNQLSDYIHFYQNGGLNPNEKSTLMRIILEAYNDYVSLGVHEDVYRQPIVEILKNDYFIHKNTIIYWSCGNADLADCFAISSFIRNFQK